MKTNFSINPEILQKELLCITVQNFRKRRDLRFDGILSWNSKTNKSLLSAAILDKEGSEPMSGDQNHQKTWEILESTFDIIVVDDNRSGEIVLLHKSTKTLIISDLLYKSDPAMVGPGGTKHRYTDPEWFAQGRNSQCLFLLQIVYDQFKLFWTDLILVFN